MHPGTFPAWTMLPFAALVFAIAALPLFVPHLWEKHRFQGLVTAVAAAPVVAFLVLQGRGHDVWHSMREYLSFVTTIGALFVVAGGVCVLGDIEATPGTNVRFLLAGAVLASFIGTTGASVLLIRPFLRTNSQRQNVAHLVPFFILCVSNAGGMLTPLGDPPLLVGFIQGVPFFWTLHLLPVWLLYVGSFAVTLYFVDRRAYAREAPESIAMDRSRTVPLAVLGRRNLAWLGAIVGAAFLPTPLRELGMVGIAAASYFGTPRTIHEQNGFGFGPILEVAILFAGLFACLTPIEVNLAARAPELPFQRAWQLFWGAGSLSAILDNAPTYAAFAALARGLSAGQDGLVAGIAPLKLAAISAGAVVMGATTYIGNGPNLIVKAIAERAKYELPSFVRFAVFAFVMMLPAHLVMTAVLTVLER